MSTMTRRESVRLLALLGSFVVAGYAGARLLAGNPAAIGGWFVGSAIAHDLLLFPLYAGCDAALVWLLRHRPAWAVLGGVRWLNYLRVPAAISGVLLLVWAPLILRLPTVIQAASGLSAQPLLPHWLGVTAVLFAISIAVLTVRMAVLGRGAR
ncbi:MAG TPA: hypothetical protein VFO16_17485 [Pseudonocardiaceae bacterium]|nr:hypothetical protein [Pseudonocardiaceae bacterium]